MPYQYDKRTDSFKDETGVSKSRQKMEIELKQREQEAKDAHKQYMLVEGKDPEMGMSAYNPNLANEKVNAWRGATARVRDVKKALKSK